MAAPVFVNLTENFARKDTRELAKKVSLYVLGILLVFFLTGSFILTFFGISIHALRLAGGLMILLAALDRLNKKDKLTDEEQAEAEDKDDIAFSPLAMPLLSGPGAIAVIIGMTTDAASWVFSAAAVVAIGCTALTCYLALVLAPLLLERVGKTLLKAFGRIMGFILLCVGVQFMINGIAGLVQ